MMTIRSFTMKKRWLLGLVLLLASVTPLPEAFSVAPDLIFVSGSISDNVVEFNLAGRSVSRSIENDALNGSMGATIGRNRNLFVASGLGDQILQFNSNGDLVGAFQTPHGPSGIAFSPDGHLFVTIFGDLDLRTFVNKPDNRIIKYTPDGRIVQTITDPDLLGPAGIAFDENGDFYVTVANTAEPKTQGQGVFKFDSSGKLLKKITSNELDGPLGVVVNSSGDLLVSSFFTDAVLVFDSSGNLTQTIKHTDLDGPTYIILDADGNLYVSSLLNDRVLIFDSEGNHATTFTIEGLDGPYGLAVFPGLETNVDPKGKVTTLWGTIKSQ